MCFDVVRFDIVCGLLSCVIGWVVICVCGWLCVSVDGCVCGF